jgi:propionyl-CoA carboxylase alpha chain
VIRKVLIANRGEIARRVIRGARSLGIRTAVVYSDADESALYVLEADESVRLCGTQAIDTYLAADLLLDAAMRVGADAIHPGYGFLSENADFAESCLAMGITFVGPPPAAIKKMGDKLGAKEIMAAHNVPLLTGGPRARDAPESRGAAVADVGFPAIIKASAGGGGRGMRVVRRPDELQLALESARREAQAAFGDPTVFVERFLSPARHIEVQVVADRRGQVATLFERECSIQRRHQKLVEESPSPAVDENLRSRLVAAAETAARAVSYEGVGTVEFVVGEDGTFAFLEMNTRLQVEHPVTEAVTGIDLVRLQFKIAAGELLGREVFDAQSRGHAIEVRLCAEDPAAGHLPSSGTFCLFEVGGPGVRVDSGVASGSEVSPYYDSMVAKVIAWGDTRQEAANLLADSLERSRIHGMATNRDLLARILRSEQFLAGDTTTDFLDRVPGLTDPLTLWEGHVQHASIAAIALDHSSQLARPVQSAIPSSWRNNRSGPEPYDFVLDGKPLRVELDRMDQSLSVHVDSEPIDIRVHRVSTSTIDATSAGVRRRFRVEVLAGQVLVDSGFGASTFVIGDRFPLVQEIVAPGGLTAPMPGIVVRIVAAVGQMVESGDPLLVLEAMKMEHTIFSPATGTVAALNVATGDQVERGAVLAAVTETAE